MRKVHLYGSLGKEFGKVHTFAIESIAEAIQALRANFPEFASRIRLGHYRVVVGKNTNNGISLGEEDLPGFKLGKQDLHIIPVVQGSKRGGLMKIIAGVALIGLSVMTGGAAAVGAFGSLWSGGMTVSSMIGQIGMGMLLTGAASLIAPQIEDSSDKQKSFTSTGPVSTTREGGIVPIVYGEVFTGGTMVNGLLSVRQSGGSIKTSPIEKLFQSNFIPSAGAPVLSGDA